LFCDHHHSFLLLCVEENSDAFVLRKKENFASFETKKKFTFFVMGCHGNQQLELLNCYITRRITYV